MPGKDKGVIATRKIRKYETVMIDQAAVVVDSKAEKVLRGDVRDGLLEEAVDRLGRMGRETVRGMYAAEEEEEGDESLEHRIFKANAFGSMVGGVAARALYPVISVRVQ